jgi:hypothetical protein
MLATVGCKPTVLAQVGIKTAQAGRASPTEPYSALHNGGQRWDTLVQRLGCTTPIVDRLISFAIT